MSRCPVWTRLLVALFVSATTSLCAETLLAAEPAPTAAFECRWTDAVLSIDGKLDEPAWAHAAIIENFSLPWLKAKNRPAVAPTKARLLWNHDALYFAAEMADRDVWAEIAEHDGKCWENDVFELFFKPSPKHTGYYEFQVTPKGTRLDMFIPKKEPDFFAKFIQDSPFLWETAVAVHGTLNQRTDKDEGWHVEGRIPWTDFLRTGGRPADGEVWTMALCRYDYLLGQEPELSTCAPLASEDAANFHLTQDYAPVRFVGPESSPGANPPAIAKRTPLTTSKLIGTPEPPPPYRVKRIYPDLAFSHPLGVMHQPGSDRLWVWTQGQDGNGGKILRFVDTPDARETELVYEADKDRILFDICFHPKFTENGYVLIGSNGKGSAGFEGKTTRVSRFKLDPKPPYAFDPASEEVLIEWLSDGHNGGALRFGLDGLLYITSGDGTSDSDLPKIGQNMSVLLSKLLRIDIDHPAEGKKYSVPKDNPFVGKEGIVPETWAYGLRNPWRMTVDEKTGHIWIGNNGQDLWEQVYFVNKGDNYGWSVMEGSHVFYDDRPHGPTPFVKPTFEHSHSEARSLTGGVVYYGQTLPELNGAYLYGDYSTGKIWEGRHDGQQVVSHREIADSSLVLVYFEENTRGDLLLVDYQPAGKGGLYTLEPVPPVTNPPAFPQTLSETGLFTKVAGHHLVEAFIPYTVNAPFWSDGSFKTRAFALTGNDSRIEYTRIGGWKFPDDAVIVKSFQLETDEGNPASRQWIETRIMVKQQGEWAGYSYLWNDAQTDATLVASAGLDKTFTVKSPTGPREQSWHYPSRAECMVCHSRAANYVLGLCEVQFNKSHEYAPGQTDQQLRLLEQLDLLSLDRNAQAREVLKEELQAAGKDDAFVTKAVAAAAQQPDQRTAPESRGLGVSPSRLKRLVDPFQPGPDLTLRAKSYLHSNCASCHLDAGGGNSQFNAGFDKPLDKMKLVDEKPVHSTFGLADAKLIAPGAPERSVLLHRISHRETGHMPPLSTSQLDTKGRDLVREWIQSLRSTQQAAAQPAP